MFSMSSSSLVVGFHILEWARENWKSLFETKKYEKKVISENATQTMENCAKLLRMWNVHFPVRGLKTFIYVCKNCMTFCLN